MQRVRVAVAIAVLAVAGALCPTRCLRADAAMRSAPACHRHAGAAPSRRAPTAACCVSLLAVAPAPSAGVAAPAPIALASSAPALATATRHALAAAGLRVEHERPPPRRYLLAHAFLI